MIFRIRSLIGMHLIEKSIPDPIKRAWIRECIERISNFCLLAKLFALLHLKRQKVLKNDQHPCYYYCILVYFQTVSRLLSSYVWEGNFARVSKAGLEIRSSVFWANCSFFAKKELMSNLLKNTNDLLIFGEWPERFAHGCSFLVSELSESLMVAHFWWATWAIRSHCSFLVSNLSDFLTLLTKKEGMSESLIFKIKKRK